MHTKTEYIKQPFCVTVEKVYVRYQDSFLNCGRVEIHLINKMPFYFLYSHFPILSLQGVAPDSESPLQKTEFCQVFIFPLL